MKNKLIIKTTAIILLTIGMIASGGSFDLGGVISPGTGYESYAVTEYKESDIKDDNLRIILRTLINYSAQNEKASLYTAMRDQGMDPYTTSITSSDFTIGNMTHAQFVAKYVNPAITDQSIVDEYENEIILSPYDKISTLEGIATVKNAKSVTLPAQIGPAPNSNAPYTNVLIEESTFAGMTGLEEVIMPDTITTIGASAFKSCVKLDTIRIYNASHTVSGDENEANLVTTKSIGADAFRGCTALKAVTFGTGLESIGKDAFHGDNSLTTLIDFDKTKLTKVDEQVFYGCSRLTSVVCPATLTSISDRAFSYCAGLQSLSFPVYASLAKSMLDYDTQSGLTLHPVLGSYTNRFKVPVGGNKNLPANAFTRCPSVTFAVTGGSSNDLKADFDPSKAAFVAKGGSSEKTGLTLTASAKLEFTGAGTFDISIDYPVDVVGMHTDPDSVKFSKEKSSIVSGNIGALIEKAGEDSVMYIDSSMADKTLKLGVEAQSLDPDNPGTITDTVRWTASGDALTHTGTDTTEPGDTVFTAYANFTISSGNASVTVSFHNGTDTITRTLQVKVVDGVSDFYAYLDSVGDTMKNPGTLTMPVGAKDKIRSDADYSVLSITSSDDETVAVDDEGNLEALKAGTAEITVSNITGTKTHPLTVTVVEAGTDVPPLAIEVEETNNTAGYGNLFIGDTVTYTAKAKPSYATQKVTWSADKAVPSTISDTSATLCVDSVPEGGIISLKATSTASDGIYVNHNINVLKRVESIGFSDDSLVMKPLSTVTAGVVRMPVDSTEPVTVTVGDASVAGLSNLYSGEFKNEITLTEGNGSFYVRGFAEGKTTITASTSGATKTMDLFVSNNTITSIGCYLESMSREHDTIRSIKIPKNQNDKLIAVPEYADDNAVSYDFVKFESNNNDVLSVDKNGNITAKAAGTAKVTMFAASDKNTKEDFTFEVVESQTDADLRFIDIVPSTNRTVDIYAGDSKEITAVCRPTYAASGQISWEIGDDSVVQLSSDTGSNVTLTSLILPADDSQTPLVSIKAKSGTVSTSGYSVRTVFRVNRLEFREGTPVILTGNIGSFALVNDQSSGRGLVRSPANSFEEVSFTSSDESVVTIGTSADSCSSGSAVLSAPGSRLYYKGHRDGTAVITARAGGNVSAYLTVKVIVPASSLSFTNPNITIQKGSQSVMQVIKVPASSSDPVIFASSNSQIASVDASGVISGVSHGTVYITATSQYGGASAVCTVTVDKSDAEKAEAAWNGTYSANIPKAKSVKAKAGKKSFTVKWKRLSKKKLKKFGKIEVQFCTDGQFTMGNTVTKELGKKKTSLKVKGLGKGSVYYVRVRNINYSYDTKYVSAWSGVKRVKVK